MGEADTKTKKWGIYSGLIKSLAGMANALASQTAQGFGPPAQPPAVPTTDPEVLEAQSGAAQTDVSSSSHLTYSDRAVSELFQLGLL